MLMSAIAHPTLQLQTERSRYGTWQISRNHLNLFRDWKCDLPSSTTIKPHVSLRHVLNTLIPNPKHFCIDCLVFVVRLGLWQASAVMNALLKTLDNLST
jgi:hypothetical protein